MDPARHHFQSPAQSSGAASSAISFSSFTRTDFQIWRLASASGRGYTYSTTKGADRAISCFEIASFILIVTVYLPGCNPAIGSVFSTVIWSLCVP